MNQADIQYNDLISKINTDGVWDKGENVRTVYEDGSPAYSKSVFGLQVEFEKGVIPILTSKKVFWRTALKEMLILWQKQTTKKEMFHKDNVHVWDEWFNSNEDLGTSYSYQFESRPPREIVEIDKVVKKPHGELKSVKIYELEKPNENCKDEILANLIDSENSGKFIVLDVFNGDKSNNHLKMSKVQFLDTGYKTIVTKDNAKKGKVKDPYHRRIFGVGYEGEIKKYHFYTEKEIRKLRDIWYGMISRCYTDITISTNRYKNKGIFIEERWHSFSNFLDDIIYIPQFFMARADEFKSWCIDKDYFGSNAYSRDTCVWLTESENAIYASGRKIIAVSQNGEIYEFLSITECAKYLGMSNSSISRVLNGEYEECKGFTFSYGENKAGKLDRYKLSRNQVIDLIDNIKNNSQSRRLLTSFWDDGTVDKKALQECAWSTNWNVKNNTLDLILIQRSADVGLGVVFNWIQYYLLQCVIAQVCGLEVGRFIHQIGNLHYYDRHEDILLEQIKKETYETPKLWINPEVKDFFDFTPDDVKLLDYKSGEYIPMEVAI